MLDVHEVDTCIHDGFPSITSVSLLTFETAAVASSADATPTSSISDDDTTSFKVLYLTPSHPGRVICIVSGMCHNSGRGHKRSRSTSHIVFNNDNPLDTGVALGAHDLALNAKKTIFRIFGTDTVRSRPERTKRESAHINDMNINLGVGGYAAEVDNG